jgi:uncharacterized protein GlcG (DUF336 family)
LEQLESRIVLNGGPVLVPATVAPGPEITTSDVQAILKRASAANPEDPTAIIAVVDRGGDILGVRVESGVTFANPTEEVFAVDGAVSVARTAAFFSSNSSALTSRTVGFISQTTITQREVQSSPDGTNPNSTTLGPGFVAAVGVGGNFPPGVADTPSADLFGIEYTNRDSLIDPGPDGIESITDNTPLPNQNRFNVPTAYVGSAGGNTIYAPESYGYEAYPASSPLHYTQSRGIGTLPGGIPLYKDGVLVGGIGVFFPGSDGYATHEQGFVAGIGQTYSQRTNTTQEYEAEFMGFVAAGGSSSLGLPETGVVNGAPAVAGYDINHAVVIDMAGITLPAVGPGNPLEGGQVIKQFGSQFVVPGSNHINGFDLPIDTAGDTTANGKPVPYGWLVIPHTTAYSSLTVADITNIISQGVAEASIDRSAIRALGSTASMVIAVSDKEGNILGMYRMPDSTVFSIDVAVSKARSMAYYADPAQLQSVDQIAGLPKGVAITNRTVRYLAQPYYPEGINGSPPGPYSVLNDPGINPLTAEDLGPALPASDYSSGSASLMSYAAFNRTANFHDPVDPANQNGVVFFPGSSALFKGNTLVGGLGASGDGVDEDDLVTAMASTGYQVPTNLRADQYTVDGVRLPYQNFPANPHKL